MNRMLVTVFGSLVLSTSLLVACGSDDDKKDASGEAGSSGNAGSSGSGNAGSSGSSNAGSSGSAGSANENACTSQLTGEEDECTECLVRSCCEESVACNTAEMCTGILGCTDGCVADDSYEAFNECAISCTPDFPGGEETFDPLAACLSKNCKSSCWKN